MDPQTPNAPDRSRRLALFGGLSILVGLGAAGLGLLNLSLPILSRSLPGAPPPDWGTAISGAVTWTMIGAAFVWGGIGSLNCRRWTRSVMLVLAWTWLLFGIMALALGWLMVDDLLGMAAVQSGAPLPDGFAPVFKAVLAAVATVGGIALPALFVWAYSDPHIRPTCEARHPEPDWTEACPLPVLGLSLGLGACGVMGLPLTAHSVVPFFGVLVTGTLAALLIVVSSAACLWLARATYRLRPSGWWGTMALLVGLGISVAVTFVRRSPSDYLEAFGFPPEQAAAMAGTGPAMVGISVAITAASVVYLARIRKYFPTSE